MKSKYAKKDDIPEALREHYVENTEAGDGSWILDTDVEEHPRTAKLNSALKKERETNAKRQARLEAFEAAGLTPEQIQALDADAAALREEKLKASGNVEEIVKARVDLVAKAKDKEIESLKTKLSSTHGQLSELVVMKAVRDAAVKVGVRPEAYEDVELHASRLFVVEDGKPVPKADGQVLYGKNGTDPLSPAEWLEGMVEKKSHWLGESSGSGSGGPAQKAAPPMGARFVENTPAAISANLEDIASGKKEVRVG